MIELTVHTEIARPPADVFAYVTDPGKLADVADQHRLGRPGGAAAARPSGSRLREVHRAPGGKQLASLVRGHRVRA